MGTCIPTGYPAWSRIANIGDYGGAPDKRASETEGETTYAYAVYRELQAQRGSAYTKLSGTLVHVEHLALARTLAATFFQLPEKARANATPARSDERLEYWAQVLGIPFGQTDQRWQVRQRCAAHYVAAKEPTIANIREALATLLGDAFIEVYTTEGASLSAPPSLTFWPVVNPGIAKYDLGGGTWMSERCRLFVHVQQPNGMLDGDFLDLVNVHMFALLDRILPARATWGWGTTADGFTLDESELDFDAL
jgi:hypothetical protein